MKSAAGLKEFATHAIPDGLVGIDERLSILDDLGISVHFSHNTMQLHHHCLKSCTCMSSIFQSQ